MRTIFAFVILAVSAAAAQYHAVGPDSSTISTTGDAQINVAPDRVMLLVGVQTRDHNLETATSMTDASVKKVIVGTYTYCCDNYYGRYSSMSQNVVQNVPSGGVGSEGTVALGKIPVSASVSIL